KGNGYRSLHTAVAGPRQLALEVQIRTRDMHHDSELGVAAHWRYKENKKSDAGFDDKLAWLRQILAWKAELADSGNLQEQFKNELLQDRVYVFTPLGKVMDLPRGATPVDFAYTLHTDLGHRTRGAKVDGNIVPLKYQLQNGQRVEILTAKQGAPSRDWLSPQLGYIKSARVRAKVRHWFKTQNLDDSIAQGRLLFERELQRLGVSTVNQEKVAQRLRFHKLEELLAALGRNEITPRRIALAIQQEVPTKPVAALQPVVHKHTERRTSSTGVLVEGVGNLMIKLAKCCKPEKPDAILGYVTRDRGITIHRQDCAFMQRVPEDKRERMLSAVWVEA
ncbi:MAG: bifunctional (p)ppGpp synthetase/guanosine-3',5'-bis(diphosphate) 3'-pyrophosphohydrolase, partial [Gallionella sp.]